MGREEVEGGEAGEGGGKIKWGESDQSFAVQADEGEVGGTKTGNGGEGG